MENENTVNASSFLQNLPDRTLTQIVRFPSAHKSGFTISGFVAWRFDGINATSPQIWGNTRQAAIDNLNSHLANL